MAELIRKFKISPSGMLLLSGLVFFFDSELLIILFVSVLIHELGHICMLQRMGVYIRKIDLSVTGLCIQCNTAFLSSWSRFLCAAAGPFAGACAAILFSAVGTLFESNIAMLAAGVGLILSLFNLLPARPLDGWRMINAFSPVFSERLGAITSVSVLLAGIYCMFCGYGTALAMIGLVLVLKSDKPHITFGFIG